MQSAVHYNPMLRSKTACHAAIWHGEIRLDEIQFKVQEEQGLACSSTRSVIYKYQEQEEAYWGMKSDTSKLLSHWTKKKQKKTHAHQHLAFVISVKRHNRRSFPGQMILRQSQVFIGSWFDLQWWKHVTRVDLQIFTSFSALLRPSELTGTVNTPVTCQARSR